MSSTVLEVPLHEATRDRFLNYAVSVITSRALPDVRDGLKPVQRRILYTMAHDLGLRPEKPPLKCARVVGTVLGSYHPHGDAAVYEALVRLAQDWVLRYPLVEGQGNFGSLDGDPPAAYRYTEARLRALALEFTADLEHDTVDFRPNFDDSTQEPTVLPASFPQLLANGCSGIAVGVATNIPPHNLRELVDACLALLGDPECDLMAHVKGPDFPTGGEMLAERDALRRLYVEGQGSVKVRGEVVPEEGGKLQKLIIKSIPYLVAKSRLVEDIAAQIEAGRVPGLVNVRDESAEDVRIVLELHPEAPARQVLSRLYRLTPLESSFHANFTCLGPDGSPARMSLRQMLNAFLDFRREVVTRRLAFELRCLNERLHVLDGFERVFADLKAALELIRTSEGKAEAALALQQRYQLDETQAEAVLELKLYRIGRRDVQTLRAEREELLQQRQEIESVLSSPARIAEWIRLELNELRRRFGDARRTRLRSPERSLRETAPRCRVLLSSQGWICRCPDGQEAPPRDWVAERTLDEGSVAILFTSRGSAYSLLLQDVPTEPQPVQKLFAFADEERVVTLLASDERRPEAVYVARDGTGARFSLDPYRIPSTRAGRRFARHEAVLGVEAASGKELLTVVSRKGMAHLVAVERLEAKTGRGA
ncbi:MAG: DNA topoisomerase (ATP-hydrolyzing), partial [Candidatus Eremiobacterota bacterium]